MADEKRRVEARAKNVDIAKSNQFGFGRFRQFSAVFGSFRAAAERLLQPEFRGVTDRAADTVPARARFFSLESDWFEVEGRRSKVKGRRAKGEGNDRSSRQ